MPVRQTDSTAGNIVWTSYPEQVAHCYIHFMDNSN